MLKVIPKISTYMTTAPNVINAEATVYEAMEMMQNNHIRHLPVIKELNLIGLISESDVKNVFALAATNPKNIKVEDICSDFPYVTRPDALINEVATEMVEQKISSALVLENGKLVGIFTATDACKALSEIG